MTRPAPPRLASWLLQRFAFGPERESLIGDIVEQYERGRSSTWYLRQSLATVALGSVTCLRTHPRPLFRAWFLTITVSLLFARTAWSLMSDIPGHGWLIVVFNLGVFGYCSAGFIVLLLTMTDMDERVSLSLVEPTSA